MKNFLIITSEAAYFDSAENVKRARQLIQSFPGFAFFFVNLNPHHSRRDIAGFTQIPVSTVIGDSISGLVKMPDIREVFARQTFSIVYFDSLLVASYYVPRIRKMAPRTIIILDSFTSEELWERMVRKHIAHLEQFKPFLKYKELELLMYRQVNFVFVRSRFVEQRILKDLRLLRNIHIVKDAPKIPDDVRDMVLSSINPPSRAKKSLVTIIVLVHNQVHFTKQCLESIFRASAGTNYELLVIDNGSTDGTSAYLAETKAKRNVMRIMTNTVNRGYTKAINQGLRVVKGDYVVLLNNDTIVMKDWLLKMIECLESDARIGAVCPVMDFSINGSGVGMPHNYFGFRELRAYAASFETVYANMWIEVPFISFRCVMFPKRVLERIGLLDDSFNKNTLSDVDYCFKIRESGMRLISRTDVFIYHYEFGTQKDLPDFGKTDGEKGFGKMILRHGPRMLEYFSHFMEDIGPSFISVPLPGPLKGK